MSDEDFNFAKRGAAQLAILQIIEDALVAGGESEKVWPTEHGNFTWHATKLTNQMQKRASTGN